MSSTRIHFRTHTAWRAVLVLLGLGLTTGCGVTLGAGTDEGEIQARPAPVYRCPGLPCVEPNVFNISVAVHFNASAAQLTAIRNLVTAGSAMLFDATDGQAQIGEAFIYNNAFGTIGDLNIYPATSPTWWCADTGNWKVGGGIHVSIDNVVAEGAPGESLAHEFVHLVFDARDEYETRAVGCGDVTGSAHCPNAAAGQPACLMDDGGTGVDGAHSELCWGHGDPAHLTDITGGNHDATTVTEQSRCRANRSCWEQVLWSWPDHFTMPAGAPDPGAGGAVATPPHFVEADDTVRVVLVLDESGSMSLESPSRMARLQVAANDFVDLAENGTELGIVSFSDDAAPASGHAGVAIAALNAAHRAACAAAIGGLTPGEWTNIGDGLDKARAMIMAAGGVTANTYIVLMTDGLNNRPQDDPGGHLTDALTALLADGIPVYVTCTGGDLGVSSQCAEIAAATGGFYVDSADSADLPQAFADFHENFAGREAIGSKTGYLKEAESTQVLVEDGSDSATFALIWDDPKGSATLTITDPAGVKYVASDAMAQGWYRRFSKPAPGTWQMTVTPRGTSGSRYVTRAYLRNQTQSLTAGVRRPRVLPGGELFVYAYPRSLGGPISQPKESITGAVLLPNGQTDAIRLRDDGQDGDDLGQDGIYTGVYRNTKVKGPYRFQFQADINRWGQATDRSKYNADVRSPHFSREVRVSAAVGEPEDTRPLAIVNVTGCTFTGLNVTFSVPVTERSAGTVGNYTIKGLVVRSAKVLSPTLVRLTTSEQVARMYTLVAEGLVDAATGRGIAEPGNAYTFEPSKECLMLEFTRVEESINGAITLAWTGGGTLQVAPSVLGPWQDVAKATSPYAVPRRQAQTARSQFFRLRR